MFEALKRLFGKKQSSAPAKPAPGAQRSQPRASNADYVAATFILSTVDNSPGDSDPSCDNADTGSCDSGSSGGD
jgi:hypothetical protein